MKIVLLLTGALLLSTIAQAQSKPETVRSSQSIRTPDAIVAANGSGQYLAPGCD
jgi:hypothetical protein